MHLTFDIHVKFDTWCHIMLTTHLLQKGHLRQPLWLDTRHMFVDLQAGRTLLVEKDLVIYPLCFKQ